jgi:hypoxanthine phosphoribosyltransferase
MKSERFSLKAILSEAEIGKRTAEIADQIARDCPKNHDGEIVVVGLLKGSFMFMADIVRLLHQRGVGLIIDFMSVSSYRSGTTAGELVLSRDITTDVGGRFVLLMDDILDTGHTLHFVRHHLSRLKPSILKTCVFLDKPEGRKVEFSADYVGYTVPNQFVVGYGLDYDGRFRELPYVAVIEFEKEMEIKNQI